MLIYENPKSFQGDNFIIMESFFLSKTENEDWLYSQIRDCSERAEIKKQIECFWEKYRKYAPVSEQYFLSEIQKRDQFKQRWWEMILAIGLLNIGTNIQKKSKKEGPDIIIGNPPKTYIEAIAPKMGEAKDKLPEMQWNGVFDLPKKQFLLRLTSSFCEKYNKFKQYIKKGLISVNDICIIAISICNLDQYGSLMDHPCDAPLQFLAGGAGNLVISSKGDSFVRFNSVLEKANRSPVKLDYFFSTGYSEISAVIYSNVDLLNCPDSPEQSFVIVKNPFAKNPIPKGLFKGVKTYKLNSVEWLVER